MSRVNAFVAGVVTALIAAAVGIELAKRPEERTWKGTVAGVPYNFRFDEWPNIAKEYWNPESDNIMAPHAVGLGWGVNFAALSRRAQALMAQAQARLSERARATTTTDAADSGVLSATANTANNE
ncbi:MAG: hypothetical protein ABI068_13060 [Ktedonobacterales bacterium]